MRSLRASPLSVTIVIPPVLASVVEGRDHIELGVPPSANVGDLLESLLKLYPKLWAHVAHDRKPIRQHINLFVGEQAGIELASGQTGLREGQKLYLFASGPKRMQALAQG